MKLDNWILFVGLLTGLVSAGIIPQEEYIPPASEDETIVAEQPIGDRAAIADDGYKYKTVRRLRHRRDVSEIVAQNQETATLNADGYHYMVPQHPMELPPYEEQPAPSETPKVSNEYLPPDKEVPAIPEVPKTPEAPEAPEVPETPISTEYLPPADDSEIVEGPPETSIFADDGYHYRKVIRYRRDVAELAASGGGYHYPPPAPKKTPGVYLPPAEVNEAAPEVREATESPSSVYLPSTDVKETASEAPATPEAPVSDYLPAAEGKTAATEPMEEVTNTYLPPSPKSELASDGYRYKTVRRVRYRHRRDVSEIVAPRAGYHYEPPVPKEVPNVYLPPVEATPEVTEAPEATPYLYSPPEVKETVPEAAEEVPNTYLPPVTPESPTSELADDGYRYKTVRRIIYRLRQRRDVSEVAAPANGYLYEPPAPKEAPSMYLPPPAPKDVTEAPISEYLPPAEVKEAPSAPQEVPSTYLPPSAPEVPSSELTDEGYRYKTIRRIKYRQRRDISEIVDNQNGYSYEPPSKRKEASKFYLPPANVPIPALEVTEAPQASKEYLPPLGVKQTTSEVPEIPEVPVIPEVPEIPEAPEVRNEYLPPADKNEAGPEPVVLPKEPDVPETPEAPIIPEVPEAPKVSREYLPPGKGKEAPKETSNEYLPPAPSVKDAPEPVETPMDAPIKAPTKAPVEASFEVAPVNAPLGVPFEASVTSPVEVPTDTPISKSAPIIIDIPSEATKVAHQYLPPSYEIPEVTDAPVTPTVPEETAVLDEDGYHYKIGERFRFRRDLSEIVEPQNLSNGYFYPSPATQALEDVPAEEVIPENPQISNEYLPPVEESPVESSALANDGYRYRTVRRIRYRFRHRRDISEQANSASNGYNYEPPAVPAEPLADEYLPPAEQIPEIKEPAPEVFNTYLPPPEEVPETAALADNGYRYRTVRRIRYKKRV